MDAMDWPITGVVVVADITKCPPGYTTIDRTYDRSEEADLWRDSFFGRRVTRYLCVERSAPHPGKDVLVDVSVINDRDPIPPGFTVLDYTHDSRERAIKKKVMCVRWMSCNLTTSALSELIILARAARRPPAGYTLVGELNNLMLCYKMAPIKTKEDVANGNSDAMNMGAIQNNLPYSLNPGREQAYAQGTAAGGIGGGTLSRLERSMSSMSSNTVTPLSGIPWQLSPRFQDITNSKNLHIPQIGYKTMMDIERQYEYHFRVETGIRANS